MDLSAFNFLMSTTPNAAGLETPFSAAESNAAAQASKSGDAMKTGEAFLKVLDQVRSGKTEKSAETFFSNMSARADNSSAMKDFRTKSGASENVRVVKIHLKRTRACEKTNEDRPVQTAAADVAANGQKIPVPEKNVEASAAQVIVVPQTDGAGTVDQSAFPVFETVAAPVDRDSGEARSVPADELTAADILIHAALQGAVSAASVSETAVAPQIAETSASVGQVADRAETDGDDAPVMQNLPIAVPEQNVIKTAENTPVVKTPEAVVVRPDDGFAAPVENNEAAVPEQVEPRTVKTAVSVEMPVAEIKSETPAVAAVPDHSEKTVEKRPVLQAENNVPVAADAVDLPDQSFAFDQTADVQTRRQAEDLARRLPSDVKIAISVETNAPVAQAAPEHHALKQRDAAPRKTVATPEENTVSPFGMESEQVVRPVEQAVVKSFDKATPRQQQAAERPAAGENGNVVPLPVEQTAQTLTAADKTAENGSQTAANAAAPVSSAPAGQAFAAVHQGLKGKAVSGTAPTVNHAPAREVADQIKVSIKKALKAGLDKIDVIVKHKELGTIKVHLEIDKDGNMKATLSSARSETVDLLRADLDGLKQSLADSGFNMNDESFSFNYRGERFDDDGRRGESGRRETADGADAATGDVADEAADSGLYALNIRV